LQVAIAFVLKIISFSDKKKVLDAFDRHCWDAACCSRMSEVRDYRCNWLAVKWCGAFPLILWLYVQFLDLLFFIVKLFIISLFVRWTDIHNCSKFPFLLAHSEFSQHRRSVRKRRKAVKPIAVGYVTVTDHPWCIICSLYTTLMSKTFLQESSEAFLNLKKSALPRTKKLHQRVLTDHLASQKRNFLALLAYGFHNKILGKTVQRLSLEKYSQPRVAKIMRCGGIGACIFFIEFSINFKRGRGQTVFSISQTT